MKGQIYQEAPTIVLIWKLPEERVLVLHIAADHSVIYLRNTSAWGNELMQSTLYMRQADLSYAQKTLTPAADGTSR